MGLVHMPRVVAALAKGLYRGRAGRAKGASGTRGGISMEDPHIYQARAGLFDIDYLGHLNNASYLNHAEYARWQWSAELGLVGAFVKKRHEFVLTSVHVRYRREIKPLFRKFEVQTCLCGVNDRTLNMYQTFRYPGTGGKSKIRAQVLTQAVIRKGRHIVSPRNFLVDVAGLEADVIDSIGEGELSVVDELIKYGELETLLRETAAEDDQRVDSQA